MLFPILYSFADKMSAESFCIKALFCSLAYEIIAGRLPLSVQFYRICVLRLLMAIVSGILIYKFYDKMKDTVIPLVMLIIGAIYLYIVYYAGYGTKIVHSWVSTSMFAVPYSAAVVYYFLHGEKIFRRRNNFVFKVLKNMGKASYFIFLTQKVYFITNASKKILSQTNLLTSILCDVVICAVFGITFYYLYTAFSKHVMAHLNKSI